MAFLEGSRSVAEGSEPVAVEASETFEDFYEYPAIVGLAYALSGSRSCAEDVAQEAEVARILGMAEGTVRKQLFEGRKKVVRLLRLEEDDG